MTDSAQSELHNTMTSSSSSQSSGSPPAIEQWSRSLQHLFEDFEGRSLFEKYVESEGKVHLIRYKFYFLCEGLMVQKDKPNLPLRKLIQGIYSSYILKLKLPVPEDLEDYIKRILNGENLKLRPEMFEKLKMRVLEVMQETTYPSFLDSDMYLQQLQHHRSKKGPAQSIATTNITTSTSPSFSEASTFLLSRSSTLPTLLEESDGSHPEGAEGGFSGESMRRMPQYSSSASRSRVPLSLTKDALMATQRGRLDVRPAGYVLRTNF